MMSNSQRIYTMRAITAIMFLTLAACQDSDEQAAGEQQVQGNLSSAPATAEQRWYSQAQVSRGQEVFTQNCAVCHGERAQGLAEDWRQRLPDGSFPPPPLNGSAHAWHHPLFQLMQTIETGGVPYGGQMPPFAESLNDEEKLAAIAYFQSFWDEEIYLGWVDRGGLD
jgi:mono/diheme cytochrome c family protein